MVVKKRTVKVKALELDEEKLQQLIASLSVDGEEDEVKAIALTLQMCLTLDEPVKQVKLVKKAGNQLEALTEEQCHRVLLGDCLNTLALVFTSLQPKNPLRKAITSALSSVPAWLHDQTVSRLSARLSDCLSNSSPETHSNTLDTIAACLDGFPLGERCIHQLLPQVLRFLCEGLSHVPQQNRVLLGRHIAQAQLMQSCLAAVKTSMLVIQKSQEAIGAALSDAEGRAELEETLGGLLGIYIHIVTDEDFVQAVQSTAGMAVVLLIRTVVGSGDEVASVVR